MAAKSARVFGDSIGVGVTLNWIDTSYGDYDTLERRLQELGVRYIYDAICPTCEYQIGMLKRLAADGIRANLLVGDLRGGTTQMQASLNAIRDRLPGVAVSVVGPNEPDLEPVSDWVGKERAYQRELYSRVKGDPALAHLTVLGPSLVHRESRAALGDLSAYLDAGNLHPYPGGGLPLINLPDERSLMSQVSGNKPLIITEVGYHADLVTNAAHRGASEKANSMYTPRIALEAFLGGVERTYYFRLADPWSAAEAQRIGVPASTNSFGLLRSDLSPRPSFIALRNLLRTVGGASAPVASPGGLRYGLEGAGPDVRQLLLRSADGSYSLVLWRQVSVWNRDTKVDLTPAPDSLEVVMGQAVSLARRFDPVVSDAESQRWTNPLRIPVSLAGAPVVLRLTPAGTPSTPPPSTPPPATPPPTPPASTPPGDSGSGTPGTSLPPSPADGGDKPASDGSAPPARCSAKKASLRRARLELKRWQHRHGHAARHKSGPRSRARLRHLRQLVERRRRAAMKCVHAARR